jgi:protein phosphatase
LTDWIQRLFGKRKSTAPPEPDPKIDEEDTQKIPVFEDPEPEDHQRVPARLQPTQLIVGIGHSVGMQRDHNEDALFTLTTTLVSNSHQVPFGLYIVADGMGGHQHGELASEVAIRAMAGHLVRSLYSPLFSLPAANPEESIQEIMQKGVQIAHRAVVKQTPGGGTTLTCVLILGDQMTIAHVGDSRVYFFYPDGRTEQLTRDHSLVKRLVELGQITTDEAAVHPQRNVLYRALGQGEPVDAEITSARLPESGHLLICSDGLWGTVEEKALLSFINSEPSPAKACQNMVQAANNAGGPDNISAILIRMPG